MNFLTLISIAIAVFFLCGAVFIYLIITAPIAGPYFSAKLRKGMVLILQTQTGKRTIISTDRHFKNKQYGSFLPTEDSVFLVSGVPVALAHVDMSVIPTQEACEAAQKMDDADAEVFTELQGSAQNAVQKNIIDKQDARALYRYAANVTPNYVNSRIEHKVAEILASQRNDIGKLFNYAIIFIMVMIGAGIAYSMVQGGGTGAVADSVTAATSSINI